MSAEFPSSSCSDQYDSFAPTVWKPTWVDQDNNGIADSLDQEIAERRAKGTAQEYVNVTVMLKAVPTAQDVADFVSSGGCLTTTLWMEATYGFGGMITYNEIARFIQRCPNVLLVEKEAVGNASLAYAAQQVGARTYVWNTIGLQGDPNASTAIVDTGIDSSHLGFSSGYGDRDFSKKIVGWNDQVGSTTFPVDDNGHGSHVAGLAAGNGFFSVDASGYATATWGANLTISGGGTYFTGGIMVNKIGIIKITVKWVATGTARLSSLPLYYGGKTLDTSAWTQLTFVSTPNQNTSYSLTYNVASTPLGGYDMYHPLAVTAGTGNLYITFNISWPYLPPSDGFSAWTGIAPQSKLVGVKVLGSAGSGTTTNLLNGINWIISNRMAYHITVVSLSLGYSEEVSIVNSAVLNLVNSGVPVVVAAGNSGSGGNYIYTCGSVDEVITVAAMNQFDSITSYSSQGGTSRYTGKTIKPDITAPGGSFYSVPLFSVDSNYNDAGGGFADVQPNDAALMRGTSMGAPLISGCVQILIQALGGYVKWNWTRSQALQPKMLLLMTATETYPNLRERGNASTSPTLERGGKDVHEGYGRVNLDAAVDALLRSYKIGSAATDSLGMPPTLANISVLGQRLAWARNVQLVSGGNYSFSLSVPAGADYDLYLYNSTGTIYGEPVIVAKSVNATTGGTEQFWITAPYTGTYYIVVKRATEATGGGAFTLSSQGVTAVNVTLNTPGLPNASDVVRYTQNGVAKTGSIVASMFSGTVDIGTTLTIDNPIYASGTQRYLTTDATSFIIQSSSAFTVSYKTQYYISVNSAHGAPTASQWVDQGSNFVASVTSPTETVPSYQRWVCIGYSINGGPIQSGDSYTFTNVQAAHTIVFSWKEQFYFTVNSVFGSPSGGGWYDSGATANAVLSVGTVSGGTGVRYVFTGWSGDASETGLTSNAVIVDRAKTATANWKMQYYLNVSTNFGSVNPDSGWYDAGSNVTLFAIAPSAGSGERYVWNGWVGIGSGNYTGTDNPALITMNSAVTEVASWTRQYLLTVTSPYGSPTPTSGWFDAGTSISASVTSPASGTLIAQYVCSGWVGTGSVPAAGTGPSVSFTINQPSSITWKWQIEYQVTNLLVIILIAALTGTAICLLLRRRHK